MCCRTRSVPCTFVKEPWVAIIDPDRSEAIQARLKGRPAKGRSKPAAAHSSLLAGKLFDETADSSRPRMPRRADSFTDTMSRAGCLRVTIMTSPAPDGGYRWVGSNAIWKAL